MEISSPHVAYSFAENIIWLSVAVFSLVVAFWLVIDNFIQWLRGSEKYTPSLGDTVSFIPLDEVEFQWGIYVNDHRAVRKLSIHQLTEEDKEECRTMRTYKFYNKKCAPCRCVLVEKQIFDVC